MKKKIFLILIITQATLLRLNNLSTNPPSLYWDEASLGYNAYSILKTGLDEHAENYPLARFIAFGDYKPPGYIYATSISILIFGFNEFAIRAPSAFSGIFMVFLTYLLVKELFRNKKLSLLASFSLGLSPWSIHLSRVAYEANLAALFNLVGIYFFLSSRTKGYRLILSYFFFIAAFYTFNANRIISPLLLLFLTILFFREQIKIYKWNIIAMIMTFFLLIPSIKFLQSDESKLRFKEVSIFTNLQPVILSNSRIEKDNFSLFSKIIHNRRILFLTDYLKHFSDNFSGRFLFTYGDVNPRLHVQGMGQLYFIEIPLFLLGLFYLLNQKNKAAVLIILWMIIAVIPAGTARETPHALRIASVLPTFQLISALGLYNLLLIFKNKNQSLNIKILLFLITFTFIFNISYYLHLYYVHFPLDYGGEFQYGTKEMVNFVKQNYDSYDRIFVTPQIGRPYIFFAVYLPYDPRDYLLRKKSSRDSFGFYKVISVDKIEFNFDTARNFPGKSLYITSDNSIPANYRFLKTISDLKGNPVFYIAEKGI